MNFNKHSDLEGQHAFLGASKYHWIRYSEEKITDAYSKFLATQKGTELHAFAKMCIDLRQRLNNEPKTLNMYVNDAITYNMTSEQVLYYSENCFGTADAIAFDGSVLRIHDLKTGQVPAHSEQLDIYAALFFLEYNIKPEDVKIETRIYQSDQMFIFKPAADDIRFIMAKIMSFDRIIQKLKGEN